MRKYTLFTLLWVTIILLITSLPAEHPGKGISYFDKLIHFGMFFTLGLLLLNLANEREVDSRKLIYFFLIYALITEINQLWVPNRSFSFLDLAANYLAGVVFFIKW